jgi:antitoxin VapB
MALSIKNPEVDRLARELAEVTGENITEAIYKALEERLEKETGRKRSNFFRDKIKRIQERISRLPRKDHRTDDELIGYDERGIPG